MGRNQVATAAFGLFAATCTVNLSPAKGVTLSGLDRTACDVVKSCIACSNKHGFVRVRKHQVKFQAGNV